MLILGYESKLKATYNKIVGFFFMLKRRSKSKFQNTKICFNCSYNMLSIYCGDAFKVIKVGQWNAQKYKEVGQFHSS